jgi:hypothetical protein
MPSSAALAVRHGPRARSTEVEPVPRLAWVEGQIERVEGFRVRFLHPRGRDARSDMDDIASYSFERRLANERTVADWIELRFRQQYRGFDVEVLHTDGSPAHGNMLLRNLRSEFWYRTRH